MMKTSVCVVLTVVVAVVVRVGAVLPVHDRIKCVLKQENSRAFMNQLLTNITITLCKASSPESCLARKQSCAIILKPDDLPNTVDDRLLKWIRTKMMEVKQEVEECADEMDYTNINTDDVFVPPTSLKELRQKCITPTDIKKKLNLRDDQLEPMVTCVLTKQGLLDRYSKCVNGETYA